jgi:flagellar protein FlaG
MSNSQNQKTGKESKMVSEINSTSSVISQPAVAIPQPTREVEAEVTRIVAHRDEAVSEAIKPREDINVNTETVMSDQELVVAVQSLNDMMTALDRNINFSTDAGTGKDVVKVTDSNTGEVIRQLPGEETLNFIRNLNSMVGLIFDKKA